MGDETKVEAPGDASTPQEDKKGDGKKQGRNNNQREQTPIEELYDLSKPIPKVRVDPLIFF